MAGSQRNRLGCLKCVRSVIQEYCHGVHRIYLVFKLQALRPSPQALASRDKTGKGSKIPPCH